jgi:hypothetical protein
MLSTLIVVMLAVMSVAVVRRRREHRRAERARASRIERSKARRQLIPHVSANLCGAIGTEPIARASPQPPIRIV